MTSLSRVCFGFGDALKDRRGKQQLVIVKEIRLLTVNRCQVRLLPHHMRSSRLRRVTTPAKNLKNININREVELI
jgi:hypothetical protein